MLYLCLSLPQLPLEARQPVSDDPVAIVDRRGSKRWLIACNAACRKVGIGPGMGATTATALHPKIQLIERSKTDEREALKYLAAWAEQFSSWVCFDADRAGQAAAQKAIDCCYGSRSRPGCATSAASA